MYGDRSRGALSRGELEDSTARIKVLMGVVQLHQRNGRVTIRDLCGVTGLSVSPVHAHLVTLRQADLVTWEDGRNGTLRPLVREVSYGNDRRVVGL